MALAETSSHDAPKAPKPSVNIPSSLPHNNPFIRPSNRPAFPSPTPAATSHSYPHLTFQSGLPPPPSTTTTTNNSNPFANPFEPDTEAEQDNLLISISPPKDMHVLLPKATPVGEDAQELFKALALEDRTPPHARNRPTRSDKNEPLPPPPPSSSSPPRRPPIPTTASTGIQYKRGPNGLKIPVRPQPSSRRETDREKDRASHYLERDRRRRNSESSTIEAVKSTDSPARDRDRDRGKTSSRRPKKTIEADLIDRMDISNIYGVREMWHHDGPFDALRPQRNHKKNALSPMNAFPKNSSNNTIGGSGPVNPGINLDQFHGVGQEGYFDFGAAGAIDSARQKPSQVMATELVDPNNRVKPVHGAETLGLGTSTFLEGAPASKAAIEQNQRLQKEDTLTRSKSLAHRLRGMSGSKRYPDGYHGAPSPKARTPGTPGTSGGHHNVTKGRFQERSGPVTLNDGGSAMSLESPGGTEMNPFDRMPTAGKTTVRVREVATPGTPPPPPPPPPRERSRSSPKRDGVILESRSTANGNVVIEVVEAAGGDNDYRGGGGTQHNSYSSANSGGSNSHNKPLGFLNRVRSLKGSSSSKRRDDRQAS